ncbi:MAG: CobW family GTP-binding protein [Anaerovoracaceae bacterium]
MIKVDIFSGFLGAGKTTLIKKLIDEAYKGEKLVLIENEFGEIGIDGGFLKDAGVEINEMNSGCICCSLVGDFGRALQQVIDQFAPERILIEPSGVGKLSDIIEAVENLHLEHVQLNGFTTVVDAKKAKIYMKNFGEFFNNQVEHASSIILSHTAGMDEEKLEKAVDMLREHNPHATIIATDWEKLSGKQILDAMEKKDTIEEALHHLEEEHEHHHDHEHHDHEHEHHHDHDHEHHHDHDHEHHHDHDDHCCCHDHDHDHHGHHHADEIFDSIGVETTKKFTKEKITAALEALEDEHTYGQILRAKGIVEAEDGTWIHFDYVPGEPDVRTGSAGIIGRLCVIGAGVDQEKIHQLFEV